MLILELDLANDQLAPEPKNSCCFSNSLSRNYVPESAV